MSKLLLFGLVFFVSTAIVSSAQSIKSDSLITVVVDGIERESHLFVPSNYASEKALPVVFSFHGSGSSPDRQRAVSDLESVAARESFIVLTPKAVYLREENGPVSWNVYRDESGVDDIKMVRALIATVGQRYAIDKTKIYSTGFSGGGRMSSRVGCDLADVVAAIAPVAGIQFPNECNPVAPMPIMTFHGQMDTVNHFVHSEDSPSHWHMGVEPALEKWGSHNGCNGLTNEVEITPETTIVKYLGCSLNASVEMLKMKTGDHTWPGSPLAEEYWSWGMNTVMEISASEIMWSFFKSHTRD